MTGLNFPIYVQIFIFNVIAIVLSLSCFVVECIALERRFWVANQIEKSVFIPCICLAKTKRQNVKKLAAK